MSTEIQKVEQVDNTSLMLITKAEIDTQISTAKAFPRNLKQSLTNIQTVATMSQEIADSCVYSLPRGDKRLDGPSVRLAEIVVSSYGNIRAGARVINNDGREITAQGIFHDLETNVCITVEVKRSIVNRSGQTFNQDMQTVTGNAACAIAFRNAVFKGVPAAFIEPIFEKIKIAAKGTAKTLIERRVKAVDWFNSKNVTNEMIIEHFDITSVEDINLEMLSTLSGYKNAIVNDGANVDDIFKAINNSKPTPNTKEMNLIKKGVEKGLSTVEQNQDQWLFTEKQLNELNAVNNEHS